jgi:hypothetical protein
MKKAFAATLAATAAVHAQEPQRSRFVPRTPELGVVLDGERATARELRERYDCAAAMAIAAAESAETVRRNLEARGMSLNRGSAAGLVRLQVDFDLAAEALRNHTWDEALTYVQRGEYETEKLLRVFGR